MQIIMIKTTSSLTPKFTTFIVLPSFLRGFGSGTGPGLSSEAGSGSGQYQTGSETLLLHHRFGFLREYTIRCWLADLSTVYNRSTTRKLQTGEEFQEGFLKLFLLPFYITEIISLLHSGTKFSLTNSPFMFVALKSLLPALLQYTLFIAPLTVQTVYTLFFRREAATTSTVHFVRLPNTQQTILWVCVCVCVCVFVCVFDYVQD